MTPQNKAEESLRNTQNSDTGSSQALRALDASLNKSNIRDRFISALALITIVLVGIFVYRALFMVLVVIAGLLMLKEWVEITKTSTKDVLIGFTVIPSTVICILTIAHFDKYGLFLMSYITTITAVDVMAMFGGKFFKGPKLIKTISPNKTVSGLISGVIAAALVPIILDILPGYGLDYIINRDITLYQLSLYSAILAFISQASDLFVSVFKRKFNVKDSGTIIPGHGGVLDRMDSYILTAPIVLFFLQITHTYA